MNTKRRRIRLGVSFVVAAVAAALLPVPGHAGSGGACVTAKVDSPIKLPGGEVQPSGALMLCEFLEYSPVSSLHKTYINGRPVGMFLSRKRTSEAPAGSPPRIMFHVDTQGNFELVGYVLPDSRRSVAFLLKPAEPARGGGTAVTLWPPGHAAERQAVAAELH